MNKLRSGTKHDLPDMRLSCLSVLSLLFLLTSCATRPLQVADPEQHWQAHLERVAGLQAWQASGRVGVKAGSDGWTASFSWRQRGDNYHVRIHGPLGSGVIDLQGTPQRVVLKQTGKPLRTAQNPEQLLYQATGWSFPVSGLKSWILGVPVAGQPEQHRLNAAGSLQSLLQAGWEIDYRDYQQVDGLNLPAKLLLSNGDIHVKLIARQWQLNDAK